MTAAREAILQQRSIMVFLFLIDITLAEEQARQGDVDGAIDSLQSTLQREVESGAIAFYGRAAEALVEILLSRGGPTDIETARDAIDRFSGASTEAGVVVTELSLLRMHALLARACGDEAGYRDYANRYRAMANEVGFEGHIAMAEAMT